MEEVIASVIHKQRIPSLRLPKTRFLMPKSNRYFFKLQQDKGVIATSRLELDHIEKEYDITSNSKRSQSVPLQPLNKLNMNKKESIIINLTKSLPKLQNKRSSKKIMSNEIIRSELESLSFFEILNIKQQQQSKQNQMNKLTRVSSFISEDQIDLEEEKQKQRSKQIQKEKDYDQYHKLLMEEPPIYKRQTFRMRHKADWCIIGK